jgi:hypothetical protein
MISQSGRGVALNLLDVAPNLRDRRADFAHSIERREKVDGGELFASSFAPLPP